MNCKICNQIFKENEEATIRQSWLDAGGFGSIPEFARVHPKCNEKEQEQILQGKINIENLSLVSRQYSSVG